MSFITVSLLSGSLISRRMIWLQTEQNRVKLQGGRSQCKSRFQRTCSLGVKYTNHLSREINITLLSGKLFSRSNDDASIFRPLSSLGSEIFTFLLGCFLTFFFHTGRWTNPDLHRFLSLSSSALICSNQATLDLLAVNYSLDHSRAPRSSLRTWLSLLDQCSSAWITVTVDSS